MDFLTPEQEMWRETVFRFMEEEVGRDYVREKDRNREYPYEGYAKIVSQGWIGLLVPEERGGQGGDIFSYALMCEGLARYGPDFATALMVPMFTAQNIVHHGTPEQAARYIEPFLAGEMRFVISLSEPQAGSDAANARTRARRDGAGWLVNGQKLWNSGGGAKGAVLCALVRTEAGSEKHDGLSVMLIPNDAPGVTVHKIEALARRATGSNTIFFDDVRLPGHALLGAEGQGWQIMTEHLELERISIAAGYVGCAQQAVDDACDYARTREQFGQPIFDFQVIRHMLADMQTRVDAARLLTYRAAAAANGGEPCPKEAAMAKLFASETLQEVSRQGVQIMGGIGTTPEADMERYFREGMQATIGGGTSQIQRTIIARHMRHAR